MKTDIPTILIIGATGQVGWELMRALAPLGRVQGASPEPGGLHVDLVQPGSVTQLMEQVRPDMVVNAAAYTAVDKAEKESELARAINADAVAELGEAAAEMGVPVFHYSTDFVFSGDTDRPYREDDEPMPLNVYGETKLAGESALRDSGAPHLIIRTSWVYGAHGQNFMLTMQRLAREREELRVVDDQVGAPTWSRMLAEATAQIAGRVLHAEMDLAGVQGVYHLTAAGSTSWCGFARSILEYSGIACRLIAIPTSDHPTPARRPAYSVLDNSRMRDVFGISLPDWRVSLSQCLDV